MLGLTLGHTISLHNTGPTDVTNHTLHNTNGVITGTTKPHIRVGCYDNATECYRNPGCHGREVRGCERKRSIRPHYARGIAELYIGLYIQIFSGFGV